MGTLSPGSWDTADEPTNSHCGICRVDKQPSTQNSTYLYNFQNYMFFSSNQGKLKNHLGPMTTGN